MYKVMLVEDEPPILFMLKDMIDSLHSGFQVSELSFNGKEALRQLSVSQPDLLITDIRMPFIDGLQLIKEVNKNWPDLPCIILSGYNDFDYFREALHSSVFDYILKPVKEDDLVEVLQKAIKKLEKSALVREYEYLRTLLHHGEQRAAEVVELPYSYYYPMILMSGNYSEYIFEGFNPGSKIISLFNTAFLTGCDNRIRSCWSFEGIALNEKLLVFAVDHEHQTFMPSLARMIQARMEQEYAIPCNIMIGNGMDALDKLREAVRKLRLDLIRRLVIGKSNIFMEGQHEPQSFLLSPEVENRCRMLVKQEEYSKFEKNLMLWSMEWESRQYSQVWIEALLNYIVLMLHHSVFNTDQAISLQRFEANELISDCMSMEQVAEKFCSYVKELYDLFSKRADQFLSVRDLSAQIERYIEENYMYPITNKTFQDLYGYNSTYISNMFSEIKGIPPSKYIMKVRVRKAIQMMKEHPAMSLKVISDLVGYEDPLYFSRVFKNTTGFSPKEYKEKLTNDIQE